MGFLDSLRGLKGPNQVSAADVDRELAAVSAGEDDATSAGPADPAAIAAPPASSDYDREQWRKKLRRILEKLPATEPQWADLEQEAGALGFDPIAISVCYRQEFAMMIRKIVSDQVVTSQEHRKLDLARELMGIPDAEAEQMLHTIAAEAEEFFGKVVEGA